MSRRAAGATGEPPKAGKGRPAKGVPRRRQPKSRLRGAGGFCQRRKELRRLPGRRAATAGEAPRKACACFYWKMIGAMAEAKATEAMVTVTNPPTTILGSR